MLAQMDARGGRGEISENRTSGANFEVSIRIIEAVVAREFTTNSGAPSGLDKGLARPDDADKPEAEDVHGRPIENRDASAVFPDRPARRKP